MFAHCDYVIIFIVYITLCLALQQLLWLLLVEHLMQGGDSWRCDKSVALIAFAGVATTSGVDMTWPWQKAGSDCVCFLAHVA